MLDTQFGGMLASISLIVVPAVFGFHAFGRAFLGNTLNSTRQGSHAACNPRHVHETGEKGIQTD